MSYGVGLYGGGDEAVGYGDLTKIKHIFLSDYTIPQVSTEVLDVTIGSVCDFVLDICELDLLPLVPEKFRSSTLLVDFLYEFGVKVCQWLDSIADSKFNLDPYSVRREYLPHLASLIGLELFGNVSEDSIDSFRRQLVEAVDWYKIRGTYLSLKLVGHWFDLSVHVWDMYTGDYVSFWSVGEELEWVDTDGVGQAKEPGETPGKVPFNYYKSPHFSFIIDLDKFYTV